MDYRERIEDIKDKLDDDTSRKVNISDVRFLIHALELAIEDQRPMITCEVCRHYGLLDGHYTCLLPEVCHYDWIGPRGDAV